MSKSEQSLPEQQQQDQSLHSQNRQLIQAPYAQISLRDMEAHYANRERQRLEIVDSQYRQVFQRSKPKLQKAIEKIRALQDQNRNSCSRTEQDMVSFKKAKFASQIIIDSSAKAPLSTKSKKVSSQYDEKPALTSPSSSYRARNNTVSQEFDASKTASMKNTFDSIPESTGQRPVENTRYGQRRQVKVPGSIASPPQHGRPRQPPKQMYHTLSNFESVEDTLISDFSPLHGLLSPQFRSKVQMANTGTPQHGLDAADSRQQSRTTPASTLDIDVTRQTFIKRQKSGPEDRCIYPYEKSYHSAYQRQSMRYQARLQQNQYVNARTTLQSKMETVTLPQRSYINRTEFDWQGQRPKPSPTTLLDSLKEKQLVRESYQNSINKQNFQDVQIKVAEVIEQQPFLTTQTASTKPFQLKIMRSGLKITPNDTQVTFRKNMSMAQQAILNYRLIDQPADRLKKTTKFQDFGIYKKTNDGVEESEAKSLQKRRSPHQRSKTDLTKTMTKYTSQHQYVLNRKSPNTRSLVYGSKPYSIISSSGHSSAEQIDLAANKQHQEGQDEAARRIAGNAVATGNLIDKTPVRSQASGAGIDRWHVEEPTHQPISVNDGALQSRQYLLRKETAGGESMVLNTQLNSRGTMSIRGGRQMMSNANVISHDPSQILLERNKFNIRKTQTLSNQMLVKNKFVGLGNSRGAAVSDSRNFSQQEKETEQEIGSMVDSGLVYQSPAPQILQLDQTVSFSNEFSLRNNQVIASTTNPSVERLIDRATAGPLSKPFAPPKSNLLHDPKNFQFSMNIENEQRHRIENLISNMKQIQTMTKQNLQMKIHERMSQLSTIGQQAVHREQHAAEDGGRTTPSQARSFPSSDELTSQFTYLLNQSAEERRRAKSEHDIMVDHIKQDMYIQAMKEYEKAEIETLRKIKEEKIVFSDLFSFLQEQLERDKIYTLYEEFKYKQMHEEKLAKQKQAMLIQRQKKMQDPENIQKIQETIKQSDQRILQAILDKKYRVELLERRICNFEAYLDKRDIHQEVKQRVAKIKAKYLQLYRLLTSGDAETLQNPSSKMVALANLFGEAETVPQQIILQKIALQKRRDDKENAQVLRELALSSPTDEQFIEFIQDLCQDQTQAHGRDFLNSLFKLEKAENERLPVRKIEPANQFKDYDKEPVTFAVAAATDPSSPYSPTRGCPADEDEKGELQIMAEKYVRLAQADRNQVQISDFDGFDIGYLHFIVQLYQTLAITFKQNNLGEQYEAAERNFFELPKEVPGLHLIRQIQQSIERRGEPTWNIQDLVRDQQLMVTIQKSVKSTQEPDSAASPTRSRFSLSQRLEPAANTSPPPSDQTKAQQWPIDLKSLMKEQLEKQSVRHRLKNGNSYWTGLGDKNRRHDDRFNVHWQDDEENFEDDWYTMIKSPMDQLNIFLEATQLQALPLPSFTKIQQINGFTEMALSNYQLPYHQCAALRNYLISQLCLTRLNANPSNLVTAPQLLDVLVLDNCDVNDSGFSEILIGLLAQKSIRSISLMNDKIGKKSMRVLKDLLEARKSGIQLFEFRFHNVDGFSMELMTELTTYLTYQSDLVNFTLSRMDLNDEEVAQNLCTLISRNNKTLQKFDISQSYISPKHLSELSESFVSYRNFTRSLNCSYLPLISKLEPESTSLFIERLTTLFSESSILTHVDLSGINFSLGDLISLCQAVSNSRLIQAFHLSDQNLTTNQHLKRKILTIFGIEERQDGFGAPSAPRTDYLGQIRHYLEASDPSNKSQLTAAEIRTTYLKSLTSKQIVKNKRQATEAKGISNLATGIIDRFILTRKVNYPELVFNQRRHEHESHFSLDSQSAWRLEPLGKCYLCEKHKYCAIFFDQGTLKNNSYQNMGFKLIQNEDFRNYLKESFFDSGLNDTACKTDTAPIIFTTGHQRIELGSKMLNSSLFALLSIHEQLEIAKDSEQAKKIKQGLIQLLNNQKAQEVFNFQSQVDEYGQILQHKLLKNELIDTHLLNSPSNMAFISHEKKVFMYAGYFPAGHHQIFVYCPESDTFWHQDALIDISRHFPINEHPPRPESLIKDEAIHPDIWALYEEAPAPDLSHLLKEDFKQSCTKSFLHVHSQEKVINLPRTVDLIEGNYSTLCNLYDFLKLASADNVYPLVDYAQIKEYFTALIEQSELIHELQQKQQPEEPGIVPATAATPGSEPPAPNEDLDVDLPPQPSLLETIIEQAYYTSKYNCKGRTSIDLSSQAGIDAGSNDKQKQKQKKKQKPVKIAVPEPLTREETLAQPADRGGLLTFILQLSKHLSKSGMSAWTIETYLQLVFHKIEEQLVNNDIAMQEQYIAVNKSLPQKII